MHHLGRACRGCGFGHILGAKRLHGFKSLLATFEQYTCQINDDVGACCGAFDGWFVAHVGLHRVDLPHGAQWPDVTSKIRAAHGHANTVAFFRQMLNQLPPNKT